VLHQVGVSFDVISTRLNARALDLLTDVADDICPYDNVLPPPEGMGS